MITIYSTDNRWRATLDPSDDGVDVRFYQFKGLIEKRGLNVSQLDPADLPPILWKQVQRGTITEQPLHVVRDHVALVLAGLVMGGPV